MLTIVFLHGCSRHAPRDDGNQLAGTSTVILLKVDRSGNPTEKMADTNALVAAFRAAGFSTVLNSNSNAKSEFESSAVHVSAVAGGDEYCLEALVWAEKGTQGGPWKFEWRQYRSQLGRLLDRYGCSSAFVAGLKDELSRRGR